MLCATDYETLLLEISKTPALWDSNHPDHHFRVIVERHWEEIGEKVGMSKIECRKKWKYFKDQYRKELRKDLSSATGEFESQWPLYAHMKFMRKQMQRNISECSHCTTNSGTNNGPDNEISNDSSTSFIQSNICNSSINDCGGNKKSKELLKQENKKRKFDKTTERFLQLEEKKAILLGKLTNDDDDSCSDDLMFFKSLLPFMKKFDDVRKLQIRNKIQTIVLDELKNQSSIQIETNQLTEECNEPEFEAISIKFEDIDE